MLTRGIRNCNPGNIRRGDNWDGLVENGKEKDSSFCVFQSPQYGIRALTKILLNYEKRYGINTVKGIINRYAPSSENDTESYIKHVCEVLGVGEEDSLNLYDKNILLTLIKAIIKHENGVQPYQDSVILAGMYMAGVC